MSTAAAPVATRSSWRARWPSRPPSAPARRATTTRWSCCPRSRCRVWPRAGTARPEVAVLRAEAAAAELAAAASPASFPLGPACVIWRTAAASPGSAA